jgi:hypothetical protein
MTLLLFDGFDNADLMPKAGFLSAGNSSGTSTGRDGSTNGSHQFSGSAGTVNSIYTLPSSAATLLQGQAWKAADANGRLRWYTGGTTTTQCELGVNATTNCWEFRLGTGTSVLASSALSDFYTFNTWVHVQVKLVLHATAGSLIVKINGIEVINYTGQTAITTGSCTAIGWATNNTGSGARIWVDDLWVCDTTDATATQGRPNNDFLGDLKVATIVPDGAGDTTQWTPSTGSNWATLDENPPSTTDYVSTDANNSGYRDLYTATGLPSEASTVYGFQAKAYALKTDVGIATFKQIVKENSVVSSLGTHGPGVTAQPFTSSLITKRPSDSTPLSVSDINNLQIGVEVG